MADEDKKPKAFTSAGSSTFGNRGVEITEEDEKEAQEWMDEQVRLGKLPDPKGYNQDEVLNKLFDWGDSKKDDDDDEDKKPKITVRKKK